MVLLFSRTAYLSHPCPSVNALHLSQLQKVRFGPQVTFLKASPRKIVKCSFSSPVSASFQNNGDWDTERVPGNVRSRGRGNIDKNDGVIGQPWSAGIRDNTEDRRQTGEWIDSTEIPLILEEIPADYSRLLSEGTALYNEGRKGLDGIIEVGLAESFFTEAMDILSKASRMEKSMAGSEVTALGQCGNCLLAHGELKLRVVQQLCKAMDSKPDTEPDVFSNLGWQTKNDDESMDALLVDIEEVAEECESLLLEAGRAYRSLLGLKEGEVRSLFNWGLALCYRAKLQVTMEDLQQDGGQPLGSLEAAEQLFLAAIDKFEALLTQSNEWRPAALLNWGLALRDRSRLRPTESEDRTFLLSQSIAVLKDAQNIDPGNAQVRAVLKLVEAELRSIRRLSGGVSKSNKIRGRTQDSNVGPTALEDGGRSGWW